MRPPPQSGVGNRKQDYKKGRNMRVMVIRQSAHARAPSVASKVNLLLSLQPTFLSSKASTAGDLLLHPPPPLAQLPARPGLHAATRRRGRHDAR